MKSAQYLLLIFFSASLNAVTANTREYHTSESGHVVGVSEYGTGEKKTTYVLLSFENKVCIKDVMKYNGAIEMTKFEWKSGSLLNIKVPKGLEIKTEFADGVIDCGVQQVKVEIEAVEKA
ncbi:MAG: hypothetical protein OQJ89_10535 [Kangiellaceae bacterium]|nr:hypothetical protein [Kangiellaceae bacterium]MCW9017392.1 hypothetical protein [Kangiellaceae bacterium]